MSNDRLRELETAFEELVRALNVMGVPATQRQEVVRQVFRATHRTLQQELVKTVVLPILWELDSNYGQGWYDPRNAASAALAHKMLVHLNQDDLYLPLI